jgi:tight adherence protein B
MVLLLAMAAIMVPVASVSAQADVAPVPIEATMVDATGDDVQAVLFGTGGELDRSQVAVTRGNEELAVRDVTSATQSGWQAEIVFVVDTDNTNAADGTDRSIRIAIVEAVADLPPGTRVGLVSAGRTAELQLPLTSSTARLEGALSRLVAEQGSALIDGVNRAGQLFSNEPSPVRTVVVFAGRPDDASTETVASATAGLVQSGSQLVVVARNAVPDRLSTIIEQSGGHGLVVGSARSVDGESGSVDTSSTLLAAAMGDAVALARERTIVSFAPADPEAEPANVTVAIGERSTTFSYPEGVLTRNPLQLAPYQTPEPGRLAFFGSSIFLYLSIALAFLGIAMAVWSLGSMFIKGEESLDRLLARYAEGEELPEEQVQELMVQTAMIQRAVEFTESFAERRGFLSRIEEMLERADIPIRAGEAIFFLVGFALAISGLVTVVSGSVFAGMLLGIIAGVVGFVVIGMMAKRRLKRFEAQLPDALQLLAGTLRAGYSLPQGIDAVSKEIADPMGAELRRAMTEAQLGRELDDALGAVAERLGSDDFGWAVMAIGIQREVGGNLNELLMTVAETMVQRERLTREVAALTAEGRVSALILSMMPPGLGLVLWIMNPDYVEILFTRTLGLILLGLALVSGLIGLLWMKKVITIDA